MNIIIPMAGMGKRMRPHTLTTPKPLIPIAGKPIVQRLVEDLAKTCPEKIEQIAFIIGDFGKETEQHLLEIAEKHGAKGKIYYQHEALGTAHAILCAEEVLSGKVIIAFADTLFSANFQIDTDKEGVIWVQKVENPEAFGVVKTDASGVITEFVEKPEEFVSDMAIIGIYYFRDGDYLRSELRYLLDNNIREKGEYQLTNALENMKAKGSRFYVGAVREWFDCGNKNATVYTNSRILDLVKDSEALVAEDITKENSVIIEPCYIGAGVKLVNSVVGPFASIGAGTQLENVIVRNSIVREASIIQNAVIADSMIGNSVVYKGNTDRLSLGDFSTNNN